jgi:tRNA pseudouridine13 synthase
MGEGVVPPELERFCGLSAYKSSVAGVGGRLKSLPQDFVVEEITPEGVVLEVGGCVERSKALADYTVFTLEKTNWDTLRAVGEMAKRVGETRKRFSFAGTKDKKAVSTQAVSAYRVPAERLLGVRIKDIFLRDFGYSDYPVELGCLSGNRFTVVVRGVRFFEGDARSRIESVWAQLSDGFPNYFGLQRFGVRRPITHIVGRKIVFGDFEGAVMTYLCDVFEGEEEASFLARKRLRDEGDFREALKYFPSHLGYELALLNSLVERPGDYAGALQRLPRELQLMFVHAYQSFIFNRSLSEYILSGRFVERLPLVGFETVPDSVTQVVLDAEGVSPADFRVKGVPRLGSRGSLRECFDFARNFELVGVSEDELNGGSCSLVLRFSLSAGSYATVFLREFMKNEYWAQDF